MKKCHMTSDIEIAIANHYGIRQNIIVPNISWGLGLHECDLLIISQNRYATEIEIKISLSDLKKDGKKRHGHYSDKIKYLYFAIPSCLAKYIEYIPARAGIYVVNSEHRVFCIAKSKINNGYRCLTEGEMFQVLRLGTIRTWGLRKKLVKLRNRR